MAERRSVPVRPSEPPPARHAPRLHPRRRETRAATPNRWGRFRSGTGSIPPASTTWSATSPPPTPQNARPANSAAAYGRPSLFWTRSATSPRSHRGEPGLPGHLKAIRPGRGLDHPDLEQDLSANGDRCSATRSWPPPSSTASTIIAESSPSTAPATASRTDSQPSNETGTTQPDSMPTMQPAAAARTYLGGR